MRSTGGFLLQDHFWSVWLLYLNPHSVKPFSPSPFLLISFSPFPSLSPSLFFIQHRLSLSIPQCPQHLQCFPSCPVLPSPLAWALSVIPILAANVLSLFLVLRELSSELRVFGKSGPTECNFCMGGAWRGGRNHPSMIQQVRACHWLLGGV